jgi:hypothetical protein
VTGQGSIFWTASLLHLKMVPICFEHTDGRLLGIMNNNAFSNYSMSRIVQSTIEAFHIEWPGLRNDIQCTAHVISLAFSSFMRILRANGSTELWQADECDHHIGENEIMDIGMSQTLRIEGNARINTESALTPGVAKIIENGYISTYIESPETDLHNATNASCIDYNDPWLFKLDH